MSLKKLTFTATGHRPHKLGGYTQAVENKLLYIAMDQIETFVKPDETIISGMAQGWDTAIARAAYLLGRRWIAAVPFNGQELAWPERQQELYLDLLYKASHIHYVSTGGYSAHKMHLRDRWMIDNADAVFSLWDGEPGGGTYQTLLYADKKDCKVLECWSYFKAWELL